MSTTLTTELLGFPVTVTAVPSSLDEAIAACGGGDAGTAKLLNKFVGYSNAHSTYSDGRSAIAEAVQKVTGVAPKTEGEDDEKDSVYVLRALHESGKTVQDILAGVEVKNEAGEVVSKGVTSIEVEFNTGTSGRRSGGPKTPSKTYMENAQKLVDAEKTTPGLAAKVADGLEKLNPGKTVARDEAGLPVVESLAAMLKANSDRKREEEKAELAALTGATV